MPRRRSKDRAKSEILLNCSPRRPRPRPTLRGAALFAVLAVLLGACSGTPGADGGRGPTALGDAYFPDGPATIGVSVESCNGDPEVRTLEETDQEVRIEVVASTYTNGDDCLDNLTIDLERPVADRTVVDLTTGERLVPNDQ